MKKDGLKVIMISVIGLFVSVLAYPFLHEMGHVLASVLVGAEVRHFTILPEPGVLCDVGLVSNAGRVLIGFGGVIFPVIAAMLLPRRWFITWYVRMLLLGVSVLAFIISIISVLFGMNPQDDMIQVLDFWQHGEAILPVVLLVCTLGVLWLILLEKPGKRIRKYFET